MAVRYGPLSNDAEWGQLSALLAPAGARGTLEAILQLGKDLGAASFILELEYIDRDFSAAFAAFYASIFRPYTKQCRRLHLFNVDVAPVLGAPNPQDLAEKLAAAQPNYLGFVVLRPLAHAPVGTAVLSSSHFRQATTTEISVRAEYAVHVLGAELIVTGAPITQQDTRVGACAQASIWTVGRHFNARHGAPWFSLPDITDLALRPTDAGLSQSVPAGSAFLFIDNMVRALRGMERHPAVHVRRPGTGGASPHWTLPPHEVVYRYLDSGIPVILGLRRAADSIGHAVVVVGREIAASPPSALPKNPTMAEGLTHLYVMDDQRGPYRKLPIRESDRTPDYPWTLESDCEYVIVPLPAKVFMPADFPDVSARGLVKQVLANRPAILSQIPPGAAVTLSAADVDFEQQVASDDVVTRTYLTYGWKYRARALRNSLPDNVKKFIMEHPLPRYVWVTELSTASDTFVDDPCKSRVRAHMVFDATGSAYWESHLVASVPGLTILWSYAAGSSSPTPHAAGARMPPDVSYWPKVRGWSDFAACVI